MKRQLLIAASVVLLAVSVRAQGTFQFNNFSAVVDAPIRDLAGALITDTTGRYVAEIAFVVGAGNGAALGTFATSTTASLAGVRQNFVGFGGYFLDANSEQIPGQAQGTVITMVIRAFDTTSGNSWLNAIRRSQSNPINYTLAGGTTPPAELIGLQPSQIMLVPEPSTMALAGLGAAALLMFRRRK